MSVLECNLVSGDGDGVRRARREKTPSKRIQVPSCRRFNARNQCATDGVKKKLEAAIRETDSPKPMRYNRKRSLTMTEITPTKRKIQDLKLAGDIATRAPIREDDAGRRVYQQLLLNAWRRRRVQVATLSDSSSKLQSQVDQLQMQVGVLQKLRESESKKRLDAATEGTHLKNKTEELLKTVQQMKQDEILKKKEVVTLQQTVEDLNAVIQNVKNDLINARSEIASYEEQLLKERQRNSELKDEKRKVVDKLMEKDATLTECKQKIDNLQEALELSENNLECASLNNSSLMESTTDLTIKLEKESESRLNLEKQLIETKRREDKLQHKIHELRKNITLLTDIKKKLRNDNEMLNNSFKDLELAFKEEKEKRWWRSAAGVVLESLHHAANVIFPALPSKIDENTSTTNLECEQDDV